MPQEPIKNARKMRKHCRNGELGLGAIKGNKGPKLVRLHGLPFGQMYIYIYIYISIISNYRWTFWLRSGGWLAVSYWCLQKDQKRQWRFQGRCPIFLTCRGKEIMSMIM